MAKSVGILTGGGDCPGLNAVIRAVVRRADAAGWDVVAVREGWRGLVEPIFEDLGPQQVSGILPRGGTIIGTSRTNPFKVEGGVERVLQNFRDRGLDALVAIGGEDTLGVAARLYAEHELPVVGVPKTIDNDLSGTDYTFGFDTAVSIATEAIDRLHTTAESHNRVMVVEVMGRHTGWIAVMSGIAGGADVILIPEIPVDFEEVAETIRKRHARGKNFSIVVVSEGCELPGLADAGEQRPVRARDPLEARRRRRARARDRGAHRLRDARHRARPRPARRHADRRATACSPRGSGSRRPTSRSRASSGRWPRCAETTSSPSRSPRRPPS